MKRILLISLCLMIALTFSLALGGCKTADDSNTGGGTPEAQMDTYKCAMDSCPKTKDVATGATAPT